MQRRLYYLFPDVSHTEAVVKAVLIKGIEYRHIHVIAKEETDLKDLPQANLFQKSDVRHSLWIGLIFGALLGVVVGFAFHSALSMQLSGWMFITTVLGAVLGAWAASMVGLSTENVELKPYSKAIAEGFILLMIDLPLSRVDEISDLIDEQHQGAKYKGTEPTYPTFP